MNIFLKRVMLLQEEPEAGPSGGMSGEGIVIIGQDISMYGIAPKDHPMGQEWRWKTVILMILTLCRPRLMCMFVSLKKCLKISLKVRNRKKINKRSLKEIKFLK